MVDSFDECLYQKIIDTSSDKSLKNDTNILMAAGGSRPSPPLKSATQIHWVDKGHETIDHNN
jgi:hypothetical protein